jgi:hypothetical protein
MIQKIKNWLSDYKEKRRRKQTLEIIKEAKQAYLNDKSCYMCCCFYLVNPSFSSYKDIVNKIPEFKPSTFGLYIKDIKGCWWDTRDRESRINAFNKLLEIYSK